MSRLTFHETSRLQAGQQIQRHWLERCRPKGDPMAEFLLVLGIIEDLEQGSRAERDAPRLWSGVWPTPHWKWSRISPFIRLGRAKPSLRVNCKVYRLIERVH